MPTITTNMPVIYLPHLFILILSILQTLNHFKWPHMYSSANDQRDIKNADTETLMLTDTTCRAPLLVLSPYEFDLQSPNTQTQQERN